MDTKKSKCGINKKLLPMKIHYFMFFAAISTVLPFLPLVAKQLGISATATGIIYTIVPFTSMILCPVFGWLSDRFKKLKTVIMILLSVQTPAYFLINFIPSAELVTHEYTYVCNSRELYELQLTNGTSVMGTKCLNDCFCDRPPSNQTRDWNECDNITSLHINEKKEVINVNNDTENNIKCTPESTVSCNCTNVILENEFSSKQFWFLLLLMTLSLVMTNVLISLSDAACYESLNGRTHQYGKQRVWGTISYGLGALLTGYIVDLTNNPQNQNINYSCCFFMMLALMICDFVAVTQTELKKTPASYNIIKDIGKLFKNPKTVLIVFAVHLIGCFSGLQWNYKFWYLKDLGADNLLMGLTLTVQCFVAELPCLFYSGWILKKIGEDNSMCLSFFSFAVWFISLSLVYNPWWVLLVELTQGPSFGLFYATMTSYAKLNAPLGTEATMQTVLGAAFYGLGIGLGSCLGGLGFDHHGGRITFLFAGCLCAFYMILYKLLSWLLSRRKDKEIPRL